MPSTCCVPGCVNRGGFSFPEEKGRRERWIANICRDKPGGKKWCPNDGDRVCQDHFDPEDITVRKALFTDKEWRVLNPNAVPRKPYAKPKSESAKARESRAKKRRLESTTQSQVTNYLIVVM